MDLRPYGIDCVFTPESKLPTKHMLANAYIHKNPYGDLLGIQFRSGKYTIVKILGSGTYGDTYLALDSDGRQFAVKFQTVTPKTIRATIKECLMNILLAEESKDEVHGPYVPIFYEIGYDARYSKILMRTQLLEANFDSIVRGYPKEENNVRVPYAIMKIAKILKFFSERLQFNHRDLKGDNVMYLRRPDNHIEFKLIDFGLSCLTWRGLKIQGEGYSGLKQCFKEDRDLSQFIYSIVQYDRAYLTEELFDRLVLILQTNINNHHTCKVLSDCAANGLKNWISSYNFFNKPKVMLPYANPSSVIHEMKEFVKGEPFSGAPIVIPGKPCTPGKLRDPVTRRCKKVKAPSEREKDCPPGKRRDPITRRCNKIQAPKDCPPGKILNPRTGRCIKS